MSAAFDYTYRNYAAGQIIFKEGELAKVAYMIKSGAVTIYREINGRRVTLGHIRTGEIFGEMGVLTGQFRSAHAVADEDTLLMVVDDRLLSHFFDRTPKTIQMLLQLLISRLRAMDDKVALQKSGSVGASLCHILELMYRLVQEASGPDFPGLPYDDLLRKVKDVLHVSQIEVDAILDRLKRFNLLRFVDASTSANDSRRLVHLENPARFLDDALEMFVRIQDESLGAPDEFIDLRDFARAIGTTPEMVYEKIGYREVPESFLFFAKVAALTWGRNAGPSYFDRVRQQPAPIESVRTLDDLPKVDDHTLKMALARMTLSDIALLAAAGNAETREKLFTCLPEKSLHMVRTEAVSLRPKPLDVAAKADELITLVRGIKGLL